MKLKTFVSIIFAGFMAMGMGYAAADNVGADSNNNTTTMSGTNNDSGQMGAFSGSQNMSGTTGTDSGATADTATTDEEDY